MTNSVWWLILVLLVLATLAPLLILYVRNRARPLDIVNDDTIFARLALAALWWCVGGVLFVLWLVYGLIRLIT